VEYFFLAKLFLLCHNGGMKLMEYLSQEGLTTDAFAEKIGVSQGAVSRYATGQRFPVRAILRRIANATDGAVTANDFVGEVE